MRRTLVGITQHSPWGRSAPRPLQRTWCRSRPQSLAGRASSSAPAAVSVGPISASTTSCIFDYDVCSDVVEDNFRRNFDETGDGTVIGIVQGGFDYELAPSFVVGVFADATFGDLGVDRNNNDDDSSIKVSVLTVVSRRTGVP